MFNLFLIILKLYALQEQNLQNNVYADIIKKHSYEMKIDTVFVYDKILYFDKDIINNIKVYDFISAVEKSAGKIIFGIQFMPLMFEKDTIQINMHYISGKIEGGISKYRVSNATQYFIKLNRKKKQFEIVGSKELSNN